MKVKGAVLQGDVIEWVARELELERHGYCAVLSGADTPSLQQARSQTQVLAVGVRGEGFGLRLWGFRVEG